MAPAGRRRAKRRRSCCAVAKQNLSGRAICIEGLPNPQAFELCGVGKSAGSTDHCNVSAKASAGHLKPSVSLGT